MHISFFNFPISNTLPCCRVTVKQIYEYIISGRAKEKTQLLRSLVDGGVRRAYKAQNLDYVTFSGCFSVRKIDGLISHSGFMCFDIDHIDSEERLQEIKSKLINDELLHTVLLFRSPSGNGLKWVIEVPDRYWLGVSHTEDILHTELTDNTEDAVASPAILSPTDDTDNSDINSSFSSIRSLASQEVARQIDTDFTPSECLSLTDNRVQSTENRVQITDVIVGNHRMLYERIRGYLFERYGIETDHTSDIARPCYLCHDDDAYYDEPTFHSNPAHKLLTSFVSTVNSRQTTVKPLPTSVDLPYKQGRSCREWDVADNLIRRIESRGVDITGDYLDWVRLGFAFANGFGELGRGFYHRVSQFHPRYDYNQTNRQYDNCLKTNRGLVGLGTAIKLMHNYSPIGS